MDEQLGARLAELIEAGAGESVGGTPFLPLLELESETRFGLTLQEGWTAHPPDKPLVAFAEGREQEFLEAIETKRGDFEARLGEAAEEAGLPAKSVLLSFPFTALARFALTRKSPYIVRLALLWLVPSELRDLRAEIASVASDRDFPKPVRGLAEHLTVPDDE